jgi:hypothetical protein
MDRRRCEEDGDGDGDGDGRMKKWRRLCAFARRNLDLYHNENWAFG